MKNQVSFICIMSEMGKEQEVTEAAKKINGVEGAWVVYGIYDVVVKLMADNMDTLAKVIQNKIRQIPHVRSTLTFPVVED